MAANTPMLLKAGLVERQHGRRGAGVGSGRAASSTTLPSCAELIDAIV